MLPIRLRGARTHNLQRLDLDLPPGQLVAVTGVSGAGKSSLAMDTLYAEGQRRFVESFSPYARQFLERLERPPIDSLDPVAATVAVDRRAPVKSSRSTLATLADLEPYLAALFACEAIPTCPTCGVGAVATSSNEAATRVIRAMPGARALVTYGVRVENAEGFLELRESLARDGYRRLYVGGTLRDIDAVRPSEATAADVRVEVIIDRVRVHESEATRLQQAIETAWLRGGGRAELRADGNGRVGELVLTPPSDEAAAETPPPAHLPVVRGLVCPSCGRGFEPSRPALFSYNSPLGACASCKGFGRIIGIDWAKVIPDGSRSLKGGAIKAWGGKSAEWERGELKKFCARNKIPFEMPWEGLTEAQRQRVLDGDGGFGDGQFPGVRGWFKWLEGRTYKMHVRVFLARYREYAPCPTCDGTRLNATARTYRVLGRNLAEWHAQSVHEARERTASITPRDAQGKRVTEAIASRLGYLDAVGLGYLTLDRQARTLSGGEAQRAALTTALGASLTGTLFVLDEPTVGLHASDVPPLAEVMADLSRAGNTVLVIEHDEAVVRACDRVIELGPGAGVHGGTILFDGTPEQLAARHDVPTSRAWSAARAPRKRRTARAFLEVRGARENNLKVDEIRIPLGVLCALAGPSGSGKSTLAEDVIYRGVARALGAADGKPGAVDALDGVGSLRRAVLVDQSPLGRTARGNAATYTKAWDRIRARFAAEPSAMERGLTAAHFSFNVAGASSGRCETCSGEGYETVEMQFLADVAFLCPVCQGKRFKPSVLAVTHQGLNVAEVLALTVEELLARFDPPGDRDYVLARAFAPVVQVGLGYLPLGQPLSTLSGGEAQRLKLARALAERPEGALFVVDEPSAGLHAEDARFVIDALHALVDGGASVLVVEHDLDVLASADWIADLGPGGGPAGGTLVAEGTPERLAASDSKTGRALRGHPAFAQPGRPGWPAPGAFTAAVAKRRERAPVNQIRVEHANEHNLKDVHCTIPHGSLSVVTGPSGSGKSSLAFDVIFAEGQRRFMETLSPYARQFLPTLPRPDVGSVHGVPPSIALEQRTTRGGANSTVATVTEVAQYLRLLFAKVGELHCPRCDAVVAPAAPDELYALLSRTKDRTRSTVYAPAVRARKGTYLDLFTAASRAGITTARVDGAITSLDPPPKLVKSKEHTIDLIAYYGPLAELDRKTFDRALAFGAGGLVVAAGAPSASPLPGERVVSTARACTACGTGVPELDPRWFSFNTKQGQCDACEGTGIRGGPVAVAEGETRPCATCGGARLAAVPRRVRLQGETYAAFTGRDVGSALAVATKWAFSGNAAIIAEAPHGELLRRLSFVAQVGLPYLALDRAAGTLSGGEMQRLRLSAQLGSGLTGALYVLDEPTIGLHPRDTGALLANLRALADGGSTVLVVEHDAEVIRAADHLLDMGPTGGRGGGHLVCQGPAAEVLADPRSPTGQALRDTTRVDRPTRPAATQFIELRGARANNLRGVDFKVPVNRLCVVAGVSGSGKSTLVQHVFYPALRRALGLVSEEPGAFGSLKGTKVVARALAVDQSPIGRTPRSVPATFLGVWDEVRKLFASLPESKVRGYSAARFSFNAKAGRCATCDGQGYILSEMSFLPDVVAPCEACGGARFEPSTLDVRYAGLSIGDVLHLSAEDAAKVFAAHPKIARPLALLHELGVGYLQLGQGSNTLSGGEAQRLKLAAELSAGAAHEPTVYVLDEPTTGLHLRDVRQLLGVLEKLVARGDTLVVIEHHPDVIAAADWVVELGPEAGKAGGAIVFEGPPKGLGSARTATGRFFASEKKRVAGVALAKPSPRGESAAG